MVALVTDAITDTLLLLKNRREKGTEIFVILVGRLKMYWGIIFVYVPIKGSGGEVGDEVLAMSIRTSLEAHP